MSMDIILVALLGPLSTVTNVTRQNLFIDYGMSKNVFCFRLTFENLFKILS